MSKDCRALPVSSYCCRHAKCGPLKVIASARKRPAECPLMNSHEAAHAVLKRISDEIVQISTLVVGTSIAGAVLKNVGLAVYCEDHGPLIGMRFVEGTYSPPHELTGAANTIMIVE